MQKLKLQMQTTIDGFVARPNGEMDWMNPNNAIDDDNLMSYIDSLIDSSDTILMGRKMTDGFVKYWTEEAKNPDSPWYQFAKKMVKTPKVVFTKTLDESPWANTVLAKGDLVEEVNRRKNQSSKDLLVYGGANFVSSLIKENLIDEYNFFIHPAAIGKGMTIFGKTDGTTNLKLVKSQAFDCGVVLHCYEPKR
jgi:dihydrofolate reductase